MYVAKRLVKIMDVTILVVIGLILALMLLGG